MSAPSLIDPIVADALASLDLLSLEDIPNLDDSCSICLMPFRTILEQRQGDLHEKSVAGVARVGGCGHIFCLEDLSKWIKGRHGTCPTCRHNYLPELRPVDSDAEDDADYVPTEYGGESGFDTDFEDGFTDIDGIDVLDTADVDTLHRRSDDELTDEDGHVPSVSSSYLSRYHSSHDPGIQSSYGSDATWLDESVDGEQEWGLTDGDSMSVVTSEGELSFGDRFSEASRRRLRF